MKIKSYLKLFILLSAVIPLVTGADNSFSASDDNPADIPRFNIYIVNRSMHTGIVIPVNHIPAEILPASELFGNYQFIDIGWGEERYYQKPDDSIIDGARAILLRNSSVLRIEGYNGTAENFIMWSDYTVELSLNRIGFTKLLQFIDGSFTKNDEKRPVITSQRSSGRVVFFKSGLTYHLFNTCNTWVSDALVYAGFDLPYSTAITRMQLYHQIKDSGRILKEP